MKSNLFCYIFWILLVIVCSQIGFAQYAPLRSKINGIIEKANGLVGAAIINLETLDTLTFNDNHHYPMQSVFKFPLALAVLNEVDKGTFSLNQKIHLTKADLLPDTWSPIREKYPDGNVDITLSELITYTVSISDNNGCDILFKLVGGTERVNQFVHSLGISEMEITANEEEMHKDWDIQFENWTTPSAMGQLLYKFVHGSILSSESKNFLWNIMVNTVTGPRRIKGQLPDGTIVAHKTGTSGIKNGIAAATNDVGIITLPNGELFVIAVFVSNSPDDEDTREKIISGIAKAVWDSYAAH